MAMNFKIKGDQRAEAVKNTFKPGRIGVLLGGPSSEREISFKSGKAVCDSLSGLGLDVVPIEIATDNFQVNRELITDRGIDCAFIALHGYFGEDGQIQEILESVGIAYTGSGPQASRRCMDKIETLRILKEKGFFVPAGLAFNKSQGVSEEALRSLSLPLVIKPACNGSSIGVYFSDSHKQAAEAVNLAFGLDERVIVEEFIQGKELTVGVLDEKALPVIGIIPQKRFFDFEAKYKAGLTEYEIPAVLDERASLAVREAGLAAHRALGCQGCSRVDIILSEGKPFVLEINSIPGMTATSLLPKAAGVAGMDFSSLCLRLVELAYEKKQKS